MSESKFVQVVVWPHTLIEGDFDGFTKFMADEFNARVSDICEHKISDDRTDAVFRIHSDDIGHFAVPRLSWGMRWLEDVMANDASYRPPQGYTPTWNEKNIQPRE